MELARLCVKADRQVLTEVLYRYLELRTGQAMDAASLEKMLADPRYLDTTNDCVVFIFLNSNPGVTDCPTFQEYLARYAGGRPFSLPLLRQAWTRFEQLQKANDQRRLAGLPVDGETPAPPQITEGDLARASDQDLRESLRAIAKGRADADRAKRALVYGS